MYCRKCGSPIIEERAAFCGFCGEKIIPLKPYVPEEKIEIIEIKEEKLPSLAKDTVILAIIFLTVAFSILLIGIL